MFYFNPFIRRLLLKCRAYRKSDSRPLDMPVSYLNALDEADVIIKVLKEDSHKHAIYVLSDEIKTPNEICDIMNDVMGTDIKPVFVDADHLRDYWPSYFEGGDSFAKAAFVAMHKTYTDWGWSGNANVYHWLLGDQKPRTIRDFVTSEAQSLGIKTTGN
ncbi:Rossmann-fold NAD(P)-binding domain-containing protein [Secundilactobacillus paracollinoides]|uniref:hypothetical protein n=1 Tax=Secundilactobacillus paracollinoides TaxID=240427 RepID=UPI00177BF31D|nr:hypothetical protein [Secundilactobacillus paracollinoides]